MLKSFLPASFTILLSIIIVSTTPCLQANSQKKYSNKPTQKKILKKQSPKDSQALVKKYKQQIIDWIKAGRGDELREFYKSLPEEKALLFATAHYFLVRENFYTDYYLYKDKRREEPLYIDGHRLPDTPGQDIAW